MRKEESNKTKGNLVEKDMVLCKKYSFGKYDEILFSKEGTIDYFSFFVFVFICNEKC